MRLVLDTNVLLAAILADGLCRDLVRKRMRDHVLITSEPLLDELGEKLRTKFRIDPDAVPIMAAYRAAAEIVVPRPLAHRVCRDRDDDMVLATALAGSADAIVTGDEDLLVLERHEEIGILSPRRFLELIDSA